MSKEIDYQRVYESCVESVRKYMKNSGLSTMVLGISGGIDSTVCAAICNEVVKREPTLKFIGVSLPCSTNGDCEVSTAQKVGKAFVPEFWERNIQHEFEVLRDCCGEKYEPNPLANGNIKARIRMIYLRDLAGKNKGLVVDTDQLSENALGFFTVAGAVGDISPIFNLWKHEVYELAKWILENKAESDIQKEALRDSIGLTPTDGNGVQAGGDLAQIAPSLKSYYELDEILMAYFDYKKKPTEANLFVFQSMSDKYGEETVTRIIDRHKKSQFKRDPSPVHLEIDIDRGEPTEKEMKSHIKDLRGVVGTEVDVEPEVP